MADKPISFSAPMVRALIEGRKTQTRRVLDKGLFALGEWTDDYVLHEGNAEWRERLIRWKVGDRLWVREAFALVGDNEDDIHACPDLRVHAYYKAESVQPEALRWRPSIHMPRWASRLTLIVEDVRAQRLQEIGRDDAMAEGIVQTWEELSDDDRNTWALKPAERQQALSEGGIASHFYDNRRSVENYALLWDSLHGPDAWAANPWVAAISFRVIRANIDTEEARRR